MSWMVQVKQFEDLKFEVSQPVLPVKKTKTEAIKSNMAGTVFLTRPLVQAAVKEWLLSFPSPMTKVEFLNQLRKLSDDDDMAIQQLKNSASIRILEGIADIKFPTLPTSIEEQIQADRLIAFTGKGARKSVQEFAKRFDLTILDIDVLITQCPTSNVKGNVPNIIQEASVAEILPIIGLEKNKSLNTYLKTVIDSLLQVRADDKDKYTIMSWTVKNHSQCPIVKEVCKIYGIK